MTDEDRCIHCGHPTLWALDPAPDLCASCAVSGLWSEQWGPEQLADYQAMLLRLWKRNNAK